MHTTNPSATKVVCTDGGRWKRGETTGRKSATLNRIGGHVALPADHVAGVERVGHAGAVAVALHDTTVNSPASSTASACGRFDQLPGRTARGGRAGPARAARTVRCWPRSPAGGWVRPSSKRKVVPRGKSSNADPPDHPQAPSSCCSTSHDAPPSRGARSSGTKAHDFG